MICVSCIIQSYDPSKCQCYDTIERAVLCLDTAIFNNIASIRTVSTVYWYQARGQLCTRYEYLTYQARVPGMIIAPIYYPILGIYLSAMQ